MSSSGYYTPGRVAWLLRNWEHLCAAAESPSTAHQLLEPFRPGPTPNTPKSARQKGHHSDPLAWANVVADLEVAWAQLERQSLGWRIVEARMQGHSASVFAQQHHARKVDVLTAEHAAVKRMAVTLGWEPPTEET